MNGILIDNYDSFTYNLFQLVSPFFEDFQVRRNDELNINDVEKYDVIFISPGPGRPGVKKDVGVSQEVVSLYSHKPILGICLGHQIMGYVYGATIGKANNIMHGKKSIIIHDGHSIFRGLPSFEAGRYHSLVIKDENFPPDLEVLARSDDNEIMSIKHIKYPHYGVQFHPESILTDYGEKIIQNFLEEVK